MEAVMEALRDQQIYGIVGLSSQSSATRTVWGLMNSGLRTIEVSLAIPGADRLIREAVAHAPEGVSIGAGSVRSVSDVAIAHSAGARFVGDLILREDVIKSSLDLGMATFPGIATPTEAVNAVEWGSTFVKLFPTALWTPLALKELRVSLKSLEVVPTGDVNLANAAEWIGAGAAALGIDHYLSHAAYPAASVEKLTGIIASGRTIGMQLARHVRRHDGHHSASDPSS